MVDCGISDGRTERIRPSRVWRAEQSSRMVYPSRCAYWKSIGETRRMPFGEDVRRRDSLAEGQGREDRQLRARVEAVDVGARIGLGVTQSLGLGEHRLERAAVLLHFGQDVVAGSVQDSVERRHAIPGNSLAQHGVNRDAARHAGFHRHVHARADGPVPQVRPAQRHQFLVRGDRPTSDCRWRFPGFPARRWCLRPAPPRCPRSGCATTCLQSSVLSTAPSASGSSRVSASRLDTIFTRSPNPSLRAICCAFSARMVTVPVPTLPRPTIPTFTSSISRYDSNRK